MEPFAVLSRTVIVGVGATALMDLWLLILKRAGVPTLDFAMLGRWAGHMLRGRLAHEAIRRAPAIPGEVGLGWLAHYTVGVAFAIALVAFQGAAWLDAPTVLPAVVWGLITTSAPLFLLQPAMGAGLASSRTATPVKNCLRSCGNHAVYGLSLFVSATALTRLMA